MSIVIFNHSFGLIKVVKYFSRINGHDFNNFVTLDVTHEYDEYYLVSEQESLLFLAGLYSCFCQKVNKKYKKYKPAMLRSDLLYLSASNIFSCTMPC